MRYNPAPMPDWIEALAAEGPWVPPEEHQALYPWHRRLPQANYRAATGAEIVPEGPGATPVWDPEVVRPDQSREWTDIPDWLQALNMDAEYRRSRVLDGTYDGWGGGYMQSRRRGQR